MTRKQSCPVCAGTSFTVHQEVRTFHAVSGEEIPYPAEYSQCVKCGEEYFTFQQSRAATRALVGIERQRGGRLTPNEILAIRGSYGATQEQMERVVGVGKKTWGRWENGLVCQSRSADQLLREIRDSPTMFRRLAAQRGVKLPEPASTEVWSDAKFAYKVSGDSFALTASLFVPVRPRVGPMPPPFLTYESNEWQDGYAPTCVADNGARVNQITGSASPELIFATT